MNPTKTPPGSAPDKLANAVAKAGLPPDVLRAARAWLADQLVAQEYAKLGQGGHTHTDVPLRKVFVDLPVVGSQSAVSQHEPRALFLDLLLSSHPLDLRETFAAKAIGALSASRADDNDDDDDDDDSESANMIIENRNYSAP